MQIKKYQAKNKICIIKSNHYSTKADFIEKLINIAKKDFTHLKKSDIQIKIYDDDGIKSQLGIEFKVTEQHPDYTQINQVFRTLH